jgi:hypothetical protein
MDPIANPYTPGAGTRPPALTGRDAQLDAFKVLLERLRRGKPEKSMIITGLRGVGKTVLLNTLGSIAEAGGFATADTEITHKTEFRPLMARLARRSLLTVSPRDRMKELGLKAAAVLKAFTIKIPGDVEIGIDVEAAFGRGDSGHISDDLSDLLIALGRAAQENDTGVVFLLDEIQFLETQDLEALIAALHKVTQASLPVTLVGAGLPQIPQLTGEAKSYSERLFNFPMIGKLGHAAAHDALVVPAEKEGATFDDGAIEKIVGFTEGYPYFLQEYGKHVWNLAQGPTITVEDAEAAVRHVQRQLDENFFRVRVARCRSSELAYIYAMSGMGDGPYRSGEIATALGKEGPQNVAPTRSNLINKGLIYSPSHGLNEFTVPHFADFLRRNPGLTVSD